MLNFKKIFYILTKLLILLCLFFICPFAIVNIIMNDNVTIICIFFFQSFSLSFSASKCNFLVIIKEWHLNVFAFVSNWLFLKCGKWEKCDHGWLNHRESRHLWIKVHSVELARHSYYNYSETISLKSKLHPRFELIN